MIDAGIIIQMIEFRRQKQPSPPDIAQSEIDPSRVPVLRLWNSPHFLILLVELELQTLVAAGASPARSLEVLAEAFSLGGDLADDASLTLRLLDKVFPDFTNDHRSIVDDLRAMARNSLPPPDQFLYPEQAWLSSKTTLQDLDIEFDGRISRCPIIPKSEFEVQLQHFAIMSRLGGDAYRFSSPPDSWHLMMGRAGYALVRGDRSLAVVETLMN